MTDRGHVFGYSVGPMRVHIVEDAPFAIDGGTMFAMVPRLRWEKLMPPDERHMVRITTWSLVVECGDALVLVETGFGTKLSPEAREFYDFRPGHTLVDRLNDLGLAPERFTHVILTHLHLDHAGGLTRRADDGSCVPVFPNARVVVQKAEYAAACNPTVLTQGSYDPDDFRPVEKAGLLSILDGPAEVVPGIEVLPTGGHSAGHQAVRVRGGEQAMIYAGDILPCLANLRPAWVSSYDIDPQRSVEMKTKLCDEACRTGASMVLLHDPVHPHYVIKNHRGRYHAEKLA